MKRREDRGCEVVESERREWEEKIYLFCYLSGTN
mgnify:CR=1 FL=1